MRKKNYSGLKEAVFHSIDTKEKAYWLGFLQADGYIGNERDPNKFQLNLSVKDEDQIDRFLKFIGLENNNFKRYYEYPTTGKYVQVAVSNKVFVDGLKMHGCVNKKSQKDYLVNLNTEDLNLAFLLGYYDGDGTQKSWSVSCGSFIFLEKLKDKFGAVGEIKKTGTNCYTMTLGKVLGRKIMNSYEFSMPRKRRHYLDGILSYKQRKSYVHNRKVERPTKEVLQDLLLQHGFTTVGTLYGVSDNSIRKWCKAYGIPAESKFSHKPQKENL